MTLFQVDCWRLVHLNRRVEQLKSYKGTNDELPDDGARLAHARKLANRHLKEMLLFPYAQA
jgi:hypothetical protein